MLPQIVTGNDLSRILGITLRRVQQLTKDGVFQKEGKGSKYNLNLNVQSYIDFKVQSEVGRREEGSADDRFKEQRARKLQLENDRTEAILVETDSAYAALDVVVGTIITDLSGIAAQVTDDVAERRKIEDAVDTVLNSLADRFEEAGKLLQAGRDPYETLQKNDSDGVD